MFLLATEEQVKEKFPPLNSELKVQLFRVIFLTLHTDIKTFVQFFEKKSKNLTL